MAHSAIDFDLHAKEVRDKGYTILENVIEAGFIAALDDDLRRLENKLKIVPANNLFEGSKTLRVYNLLVHGELYQQIAVHPQVLPVVERVLDPGCLVSSLSSIAILPGEQPQPIHADDQLIPVPRPHVPFVCNTMWAISDFTEENGATRVVPGSHLSERLPEYGRDEKDTIPAVMPRGSVMVYNGSLWHSGGANRSSERRVGIAMNYCAGYLRQQENQQLGIPSELVKQFSPRLQELVGYGVYSGLIGHINKRSPAALLAGVKDGFSAFDW